MFERRKLQEEIDILEKEQERLKRELFIAKEKEDFKTSRSFTKEKEVCFYRAIPLRMITTPFYQHRRELQKKTTGCFIESIIDLALEKSHICYQQELHLHFAFLCENVIPCASGLIFVFTDPYRTIQTEPVTNIPLDEAITYIGKLVIAKLVIPDNYRMVTSFKLLAIRPTTLTNQYKMDHEDWFMIKKYLFTSGLNNCRNALNELQTYFKFHYSSTGQDIRYVLERNSEDELRIVTDHRRMVFVIYEDTLWYADECFQGGYRVCNDLDVIFPDDIKANVPELFTNQRKAIYSLENETDYCFFS